MKCSFQVGDKVVRIGGAVRRNLPANYPQIGVVYTIRAINVYSDNDVILLLKEIDNSHMVPEYGKIEPGFQACCFRRVTDRKTDISISLTCLSATNSRLTLDATGTRQMDDWNFNMSTAPRGSYDISKRVNGTTEQTIKTFVPHRLLIANRDGKVYATHRTEPNKHYPAGRWSGWSTDAEAVAWMEYPVHPHIGSRGEISRQDDRYTE